MRILFFLLLSLSLYAEENPQLKKLMEGNQRFIENKQAHADHREDLRKSLVKGQEPFAVVLSCSDSRVAPEIIFDQDLGELFVVRLAGNVAGTLAKESIGYATGLLGSSIILVLGHQNCGAVKAVLSGQTKGVEEIASLIEPAIKSDKDLEEAIKANVRHVVQTLKKSQQVPVFGGYYHLNTGKVEILKDESPKST